MKSNTCWNQLSIKQMHVVNVGDREMIVTLSQHGFANALLIKKTKVRPLYNCYSTVWDIEPFQILYFLMNLWLRTVFFFPRINEKRTLIAIVLKYSYHLLRYLNTLSHPYWLFMETLCLSKSDLVSASSLFSCIMQMLKAIIASSYC